MLQQKSPQGMAVKTLHHKHHRPLPHLQPACDHACRIRSGITNLRILYKEHCSHPQRACLQVPVRSHSGPIQPHQQSHQQYLLQSSCRPSRHTAPCACLQTPPWDHSGPHQLHQQYMLRSSSHAVLCCVYCLPAGSCEASQWARAQRSVACHVRRALTSQSHQRSWQCWRLPQTCGT